MASIGKADLVIVPKFEGLSKAVDEALAKAEGPASKKGAALGESASKGFGGGLAKSGVAIGAFSALTTKAMESISSHVGAAVSRFDTMNAFPAVMETLGYSAQDSEASIAKMSDRLGSLPTTLDSMTGAVQRIVPAIKDVGKSTDIMLAFNDALVAGKSPIEIQNAAIEQFSQAVSRGKFELEEWRSVQTAMPGQLDQVAKSMLGAEAGAMDLYEALKNGDVSMDEFLSTLVRLDTEGGSGFASFQEQAETVAGGVGTSMANMGNAVTKGLASLMDTVGEGNISGVFDDMKGAINAAFGALNAGVGKAMPAVEKVYGAVKEIAPQAIAAAAGFAAFKTAGGYLVDFAGRAKEAKAQTGLLEKANTLLGTSFSPVSLGVTAAAAGLTFLAGIYADGVKKARDFEAATTGIAAAVDATVSLDEYSGRISSVGESAGVAALGVDEMAEKVAKNADAMQKNAESAQSQIAELNTAQGIINQYAGQTDLSAEAQGRLEWAVKLVNDQFGLSITSADVMADSYRNADGSASDLTDTIDGLVDAKKNEIRMNALSDNLTLAYQNETDAASALAGAKKKLADYEAEYASKAEHSQRDQDEYAIVMGNYRREVEKAEEAYRGSAKAVDELEAELGDSAVAASESADVFDEWGNSLSSLVTQTLKQAVGENGLGMLKEDLRSLGASTEDLSELSEGELERIANAYDGTAGSIVGVLEELGVGMDKTARATAESSAAMQDALSGFGEGFAESLGSLGVDVESFAWKLAEAGVQTETLNQLGSENITALATTFGGNVDAMVWAIANYNGQPLLDKDGNVQLDDAELIDAQGNVYVWNGTELVSKASGAVVDSAQVVDARGNVLDYNATNLDSKWSNAQVNGNAVNGQARGQVENTSGAVRNLHGKSVDVNANGNYGSAASSIWDLGNAIASISSKVVNVTANIFKRENAAGGIRLNAEGGVRYHADGAFIAHKAAPLDIVGEDGAEAIVPLTNRRYSQPFADIIAEGVAKRTGGTERIEGRMANVEALLFEILRAMPEVHATTAGRAVRR